MTDEHPITPSLEVVNNWVDMLSSRSDYAVFTTAVQWGADRELEACCEWMRDAPFGLSLNTSAYQLRAARRPKPPSLKEQALDELDRIPTHDNEGRTVGVDVSIIRRALEQLPDAL